MTTHTQHKAPHAKKEHHEEHDASLAEQVTQKFHDAYEKYGEIHDKVEDLSKDLSTQVKKQPLMAIGFALACGVVIGKMLK